MTLQPGQQTIKIHILPNIFQSKGNQTMKFWSFNRILEETFFSSKIIQKMRQGKQFQTSILFLKIYEAQANGLQLRFNIFQQPSTWTYNKNNLYKTFDY